MTQLTDAARLFMSPMQAKLARTALRLTKQQASVLCAASTGVISRIEATDITHGVSHSMIERVQRAYEKAGIIFFSDEKEEGIWYPRSSR